VPEADRASLLEIPLPDEPGGALLVDRLRDGRIALGIRPATARPGRSDLVVLDDAAALALASWLAEGVEEAWLPHVREHRAEQLRTAEELHGSGPRAVAILAEAVVREIPPPLLVRAFVLLANSIGPDARARVVSRLNRTRSVSEEGELRRRLAEESESFGYAVAAAALFDALGAGLPESGDT
jgi:hypothetical protein